MTQQSLTSSVNVSPVTARKAAPLRRSFSFAVVGTLVYAVCQWGVITALAKLTTPEVVGRFAFAMALTAPIVLLANLQLRSVQATDIRQEFPFSDYLTTRVVTTSFALVIVAGIILTGDFAAETAITIALIALAKGIDAISDVFYGLFQQRERMDVVAKAQMLNGGLSLVLLITGISVTGTVTWGLVGFAFGSFVSLFAFVLPQGLRLLTLHDQSSAPASKIENRMTVDRLRKLGRTAVPLGLASLIVSLNTNIPRYFIEDELGQHELGIFAALAYIITAVSLVFSTIGQAASPRLATHYSDGRIGEFWRLLILLMVLGIVSSIAGLAIIGLIGRELVTLFYSAEYANHIDVLYILAAASGLSFVGSFAANGLMAIRLFSLQLPISLAVMMASVVASMILIPEFGLVGAALAVATASLVQAALASGSVYCQTSRQTS